MKRMWIAVTALMLSACVPAADDKNTNCGDFAECSENNQNSTRIKGAFVSGHLGNYMDCPDEGFGGDDGAARGAPAADFAPCPDGDTSCGGPLNCETAQLTVNLTNQDEVLENVQVAALQLYSMDGVLLGEVPVSYVSNTTAGGEFDGTLETGTTTLRIDFAGPADLTALIADVTGNDPEYTESAFVRLRIELGDGTTTIESEELFVLPMVVT